MAWHGVEENQLIIGNMQMQPIFFFFFQLVRQQSTKHLYVPGYCIQRRLGAELVVGKEGVGNRLLFALPLRPLPVPLPLPLPLPVHGGVCRLK